MGRPTPDEPRQLHGEAKTLGKNITDDAQLVEAMGHPVKMIPGSPFNLKITTHDDLKIASLFLKLREAEDKPKAGRPFDDERFS